MLSASPTQSCVLSTVDRARVRSRVGLGTSVWRGAQGPPQHHTPAPAPLQTPRGRSPLLERTLAHLPGRSLHLLGHGVLLGLGHLVHCVARVQPVRASFAPQPCGVSSPWEGTRKFQESPPCGPQNKLGVQQRETESLCLFDD